MAVYRIGQQRLLGLGQQELLEHATFPRFGDAVAEVLRVETERLRLLFLHRDLALFPLVSYVPLNHALAHFPDLEIGVRVDVGQFLVGLEATFAPESRNGGASLELLASEHMRLFQFGGHFLEHLLLKYARLGFHDAFEYALVLGLNFSVVHVVQVDTA